MIHNPILPGFHADPCICRKGEDFYLAVSSFEWFPGVPVYHSKDLKHWELYANALTDADALGLKNLPSAKGVWAPCLTYCEDEGLFYLVYGIMRSMNARYFDVDNYLVTAPDPKGPWSEPIYLHSSGFDMSLLHDADGRKYLVALEWETRDGYDKPGPICCVEYNPNEKRIVGQPKRIYRGATDRGCLEAPHLYRRGEWYYLMCAEGGTGYYHAVTVARARSVFGPYEADPHGVVLTANTTERNARADVDHLKTECFNPESPLQKAGHGSYLELPNGESWLVHLCARPFVPEMRCTLGRETAIQRMIWTPDGWLRKANGSALPEIEVQESALPSCPFPGLPERDDFSTLRPDWYALRIDPSAFAKLSGKGIVLCGAESLCSLNRVSLLAKKLTSVCVEVETELTFSPECYQQTAGLVLYYDNMNYRYLYQTRNERIGTALELRSLENGKKQEFPEAIVSIPKDMPLRLRLTVRGRRTQFSAYLDETWHPIGPAFDTSKLSDEYSDYGEFTGTFVGIACEDRMFRTKPATFASFTYHIIDTVSPTAL